MIRWLLFSVLLLFTTPSFGQRYGAALGVPVVYEHLPEGLDYVPYTLLGQLEFPLRTRRRSVEETHWFIVVEPQFNVVQLPIDETRTPNSPLRSDRAVEFGANAGVRYRLPLGRALRLHAQISAGPHYISRDYPGLQAGGFLFSDNFAVGLDVPFGRSGKSLLVQTRFRHLSNAGLMEPNKGIDNWFVVFGLLF